MRTENYLGFGCDKECSAERIGKIHAESEKLDYTAQLTIHTNVSIYNGLQSCIKACRLNYENRIKL